MKNRLIYLGLLAMIMLSLAGCLGGKQKNIEDLKSHLKVDNSNGVYSESSNFIVKMVLKSFNVRNIMIYNELNGPSESLSGDLPIVFIEMKDKDKQDNILLLLESISDLFWANLDEIQGDVEGTLSADLRDDIDRGLKYEINDRFLMYYVVTSESMISSFKTFNATEEKN